MTSEIASSQQSPNKGRAYLADPKPLRTPFHTKTEPDSPSPKKVSNSVKPMSKSFIMPKKMETDRFLNEERRQDDPNYMKPVTLMQRKKSTSSVFGQVPPTPQFNEHSTTADFESPLVKSLFKDFDMNSIKLMKPELTMDTASCRRFDLSLASNEEDVKQKNHNLQYENQLLKEEATFLRTKFTRCLIRKYRPGKTELFD